MLGEVGDVGERVAPILRDISREIAADKSLVPLAGYLRELAFLARTAGTIRTAIGAIRRIVGALKRYSRLDEAPLERVDVHAGIEDTLVILSHQLKYGENGVNVKTIIRGVTPDLRLRGRAQPGVDQPHPQRDSGHGRAGRDRDRDSGRWTAHVRGCDPG